MKPFNFVGSGSEGAQASLQEDYHSVCESIFVRSALPFVVLI